MPSEPDNRMDDLLKAYARKRRDEAGAPPEMHPATRRLLQAEAAKLRPKVPEQNSSWFSALLRFWPRFAMAAAVFVVLGIGAWSLFRSADQPGQIALLDDRQAKSSESARPMAEAKMTAPATTAESAKKENEVRQLSAGADEKRDSYKLPASTPQPGQPQLAFREELVRLKSVGDEAKAKSTLADLAADKPSPARPTVQPPVDALAPSTASATPSSGYFVYSGAGRPVSTEVASNSGKDQPLPFLNESKLSLRNQGLKPTYSGAPPQSDLLSSSNPVTLQLADSPSGHSGGIPAREDSPAVTPQFSPPLTASGSQIGQSQPRTSVGRFYSPDGAATQKVDSAMPSRNRFSQVQSTGPAVARSQSTGAGANVLTEFDLEQTGNRVRVVDADGSVYDGLILEEPVTTNAEKSPAAPARRDAPQNAELRRAATRQIVPAEAATAEPAVWNFRANGTNRTLQQAVTINGVLYANATNAVGQATPYPSQQGLQQQAQQSSNAYLPPVQRIQGRVQIGAGAERELDAIRKGN